MIVLLLVCCLSAVGVVFAFLNQSVHRGYPVHIQGTNISFKLNGKNYLDQIGESELGLYKNRSQEVDVQVEVTGSDSVVADYRVSFELETDGSDADVKLSQAIEVYALHGARYEFICMLDQIGKTDDGGAPFYTFGGQMVTNYSHSLPFCFVYSGETSAEYDEIAQNGGFTLRAEATADIAGSSADYVFATDNDTFADHFTRQDSVNKTIVLTDDIEVAAALVSKGKVGIDLNGHTLTLHADLKISYSTGTEGLGIINGKTGGGIAGTGRYKISGNDCYLIDDALVAKIDYPVDDTNAESIFGSLSSILDTRLKSLDNEKPYYHEDDLSALFDGLNFYRDYKEFSVSYGKDSVIGTVTNADGTSYTGIVPDPQQTSRYAYSITLSYQNSYGKTFGGYINVLGSSLKSIADDLMTALPACIDSSVFLRSYDTRTASHIEWIVDDAMDGFLFNSLGTYRPNGLSGLIDKAETFRDRGVGIYIKLSKGAQTEVFYYERNAEILSASERTALCYENEPIVLRQKGLDNSGIDTLYDFYDAISQTYRQKAEISGVSVKLLHSDTASSYLSVATSASNANFATVSIAGRASIPQNYAGEAEIEITFTYADGKSHTLRTAVSVLGELAYVTRYDVSYRLQNSFSNNAYIDGDAYYFYAPGALQPRADGKSVQVLVDYEAEQSAQGFVIITYEYVPIRAEDIQDQIAYFIKEGEKYSLYQGEISPLPDSVTLYERRANIEILPSRIPTLDETTVFFTSTLYTLHADGTPCTDDNGNKLYYDAVTDTAAPLQYKLTLTVQGIIQNSDAHISDYSLYTMLRDCFDANKDGIISSGEAQADWNRVLARGFSYAKSVTVNGTVFRYLDFSGVNFSSLKGIEYFVNLQGLSFASSSITDIACLSSLTQLNYLDLSDNAITDISAFAYSDALQYLNLADNQITSIEALRYLPALETLDLTNNKITDFDPLTVTDSLISLTLTGMKNANGQTFDNDPATLYSLATIQINNPTVTFVYDQNILIGPSALIAAKVIHDVEEINRVNQTLYLPTTYYYSDGSEIFAYKLNWFADDTQTNLIFQYTDGEYSGYTVSAPLFEKQVTIRLQIHLPNSTNYYTVSRSFTLTLETSASNHDQAYVYDPSVQYYIPAEEAFPDLALRNKVFDTFNKITDRAIDIKLAGGSVISCNETSVLSAADYERYLEAQTNIDWSNAGIRDLSGIRILKDLLTLTLDLSGNAIISLEPVASLTSLTGLILGGKNYDFSELYSADKLTTLKMLDVSKSYGLDEESTLNALYQVYLNNSSVSVYLKNSSQVWDPYETLLPKNIRNLPSVLAFVNLNESYPIYGSADATSFDFTFYDQPSPLSFTVDSVTIYENQKANITKGTYFQFDSNAIKYIKLYGWSESAFLKISISANDGHLNGDGTFLYVTGEYYVQLNAQDAGSKIFVYNDSKYPEDFTVMTLSELFVSRDLREYLLGRQYGHFNGSDYFRIKKTPEDKNGDGKIQSDEVTLDFIFNNRDNNPKKYFVDDYGNYHIGVQGVNDNLSLNNNNFTINGAFDRGENFLHGLKYLPGVKNLTISRDANLGDGSELVNITQLTLNYSAVDLTTITQPLPLLESLTIQNFNSLIVNAKAMKYFPTLTALTIVGNNSGYLQDFTFLEGLINEDGTSMIRNLTMQSVIQSNANIGISVSNAEFVKELYIAAGNALSSADNTLTTPYGGLSFKVGTANKNNDTGAFFIVLPDGTYGTAAKNTASALVTSWTAPANGSFDTTRSEAQNYATVTNAMLDMGLQYKQPAAETFYWLNKKTYSLPISTVLTLPKTTGATWFALQYDSTILRSYDISWRVFVNTSDTMDNAGTDGGTLLSDSFTQLPCGTLTATANEYVLTLTANCYVVILGLVSPPSGVSGNTYSYVYHFVSGSGDGFYSNVEDYNLRATLFASATQDSNKQLIDFSDSNAVFQYKFTNNKLTENRIGTVFDPLPNCTDKPNYPYKVYTLKGFTKVLSATDGLTKNWGSKIIRLGFSDHKITDISDLVQLRENNSAIYISLQSLDLTLLTLNLPDGFSAAFPVLTDLSVSGNIAFTPYDLQKLWSGTSDNPNSTIRLLYIDGTRCRASYDALVQLCAIASGNASKSFSALAWNSTEANTVTAAELQVFQNTIGHENSVTALNGTLTSSSSLTDGSETALIGGIGYTYTWDAYTFFTARSVSQNPVDTTVAVSSNANAQFVGVRFPVRFSRPDSTSVLYIAGDEGDHDISYFDSQLVSYLFANNCFTETVANSNRWTLNQSVTVETDIGISDLKNLHLLQNGAYSVTVAAGTNPLAYKNETYTVKENKLPTPGGTVFKFLSVDLVNLDKQGTIKDFLYYDSIDSVYTVKLPSYLWMGGNREIIVWSISGNISQTDAQNYITFTTDADGAILMIIDSSKIPANAGVGEYLHTLTATVNGTSQKSEFTIRHGAETSNAAIYYDTYVQVAVVNGQIVLQNAAGETYYVVEGVTAPDATLNLYNNKFYTQYRSGAVEIPVVFASTIIQSGRFRDWLQTTKLNNDEGKVFGDSDAVNGYILSKSFIGSVTALSFGNFGETNSKGITSISGIEIFYNLKNLTAAAGAFSNIEALSSLHLTSFVYGNSDVGITDFRNFIINDFTPLLKGSQNTLETFSYNGLGTTQMTDLNFLLGFAKLKTVNIATSTSLAGNANGLSYLRTSSFQYLLNALHDKGVNVFVHKELADKFGLTYDTDLKNGTNVYALVSSADFAQASEILSRFAGTEQTVTLENGYRLTADISNYAQEGNNIIMKLPAAINRDGTLYRIEWIRASANVAVNGYYLTKALQIGNTLFDADIPLTASQAQTILASTEYYAAQKSGETLLYSSVTVQLTDPSLPESCIDARAVCRIFSDGYAYERTFTLSMRGNTL